MAKLNVSILGHKILGTLADAITFDYQHGIQIVKRKPIPTDRRSDLQLAQRQKVRSCGTDWQALDPDEKQAWIDKAKGYPQTAFGLFLSMCLMAPSGVANLNDIGDVNVPTPGDGNVLYRNAATSKWEDKPTPPVNISCRVTHSVSQSIPTSTTTTLTFDTERWDTDTIHDLVTNPERLTCKTAGKYIANFTAQWASSPAARYRFFIYKNSGVKQAVSEVVTGATGYPGLTVSAIVDMAVNDYLYVAAWQNSGGAVDVNKSNQNTPEFAMIRIA